MSLQARFFKKGVCAERDCEHEWGVQVGHPCECPKRHSPAEYECAQLTVVSTSALLQSGVKGTAVAEEGARPHCDCLVQLCSV